MSRSRCRGRRIARLLIGDLEVTVRVDHVLKAELSGEPIRAAERLRGEPGQLIDVIRSPFHEQPPQHRIGEDFRVGQLLEGAAPLPACMLVETCHPPCECRL
jgi:hypothetical protein